MFNFAGAAGVAIFFVLSGSLQMRKAAIWQEVKSPRRMLHSAITKMYPLHFATFLVAIPLMLLIGHNAEWLLPRAICQILLIQSWIPSSSYYYCFNTPAWYLSTYLFLVFISSYLVRAASWVDSQISSRHRGERIGAFIIGLALVGLMAIEYALTALPLPFGEMHWIVYVCPPVRAIDFFAGMLLFCLLRRIDFRMSTIKQNILFIASLALLTLFVMVTIVSPGTQLAYYSAFWLIPALGISSTGFLEAPKGLSAVFRSRFLVFVGNISMAFFLTHWLLINYAVLFFPVANHPFSSVLLLFMGSLLVSYGVHKLLGLMNRTKKRSC